MYTITKDAKIALLGDRKPSKGEEVFEDAKSLREAIQDLTNRPMAFLVGAFNSIPGVKKVKKFETFEIAQKRVLKACANWRFATHHPTAPAETQRKAPAAIAKPPRKGAAKATRAPKAAAATVGGAPREGTRKAEIIKMLEAGATREQIQQKTGWAPHSVRGFLSTLNKTRPVSKDDKGVYRVEAAHG